MPLTASTALPNKVEIQAHKTVTLPAALERNRLLDVFQMADLLGFSVAHVRRMYRTGKLPAPVRIGGRKCGWPAHVAAALTGSNFSEAA